MKVYTKNKKARWDFTIIKEYEAGMKLTGVQVKAIASGNIQLRGSYVTIKDGQMSLTGVHISKPSSIPEYDTFDPNQSITLLMNKKEIKALSKELEVQGITLVALEVYKPDTSNYIKLKMGLAKGKKHYDKRHELKKKDDKMQEQKALKDYQ